MRRVTPFIPSSYEACAPPLEGAYVCAPTSHVARGRTRSQWGARTYAPHGQGRPRPRGAYVRGRPRACASHGRVRPRPTRPTTPRAPTRPTADAPHGRSRPHDRCAPRPFAPPRSRPPSAPPRRSRPPFAPHETCAPMEAVRALPRARLLSISS
jgi:hypothetical protein